MWFCGFMRRGSLGEVQDFVANSKIVLNILKLRDLKTSRWRNWPAVNIMINNDSGAVGKAWG